MCDKCCKFMLNFRPNRIRVKPAMPDICNNYFIYTDCSTQAAIVTGTQLLLILDVCIECQKVGDLISGVDLYYDAYIIGTF